MVQNQELLYATYAMLLKQGIQVEGLFKKKAWGAFLTIKNDYKRPFFELYFPNEIFAEQEINQVSSQIAMLFPEKLAIQHSNVYTCFNLLVGQVGISIGNALNKNETVWLLGGDSVAIEPCEYSLRSSEHPVVLAQISNTRPFAKKTGELENYI